MPIHPKRFAALLISLVALTSVAPAIEVELDTGKKIQVKRVTYDSSGFTLYDSTKTKFPASRVKLLDADESRTELNALYAKKSLEKLERDSALEIENLKKALEVERKNVEKLAEQSATLTEFLQKKKEEAAQFKVKADTADALLKENKTLRAARVNDQSGITVLKKTIADLKAAAKPKAPAPPPKPVVVEVRHIEAKAEGLVKVMGRIQNPGSESVRAVVLEVSVLDKEGKLLTTGLTFVTDLEPKVLRPFWTDVEAEMEEIGKIEVVVADVLREKKKEKQKKKK